MNYSERDFTITDSGWKGSNTTQNKKLHEHWTANYKRSNYQNRLKYKRNKIQRDIFRHSDPKQRTKEQDPRIEPNWTKLEPQTTQTKQQIFFTGKIKTHKDIFLAKQSDIETRKTIARN